MKRKEYERLAIGDVVSPMKGHLKGFPAKVTHIYDEVYDDGVREIVIHFEFLDPEIEAVHYDTRNAFSLSYQFLKFISKGEDYE